MFDVQSKFTAKRLLYLSNFPLVCQLPAVSRDRGLSEAIAADFLFEAIQLVTCEITLSFLLAFLFFLPPTYRLISFFFFFSSLAKFGQKIITFKQQQKKALPSGCAALGDTTLGSVCFIRQQTAFVLHHQR